ncbi:gamma-glutamyl phosphate reductase [Striga asiatica]|uniref:Gamma-glutamyl phosphate reductase n=1 Tax=Striga asiatica TaxID=4170 RepID=A0A5A7QID2_STRAF|nr:gamma-glutamyl phosphate reductase [Striga asiatica]
MRTTSPRLDNDRRWESSFHVDILDFTDGLDASEFLDCMATVKTVLDYSGGLQWVCLFDKHVSTENEGPSGFYHEEVKAETGDVIGDGSTIMLMASKDLHQRNGFIKLIHLTSI